MLCEAEILFKVCGYTFKGSNSASFIFVSLLNGDQLYKEKEKKTI